MFTVKSFTHKISGIDLKKNTVPAIIANVITFGKSEILFEEKDQNKALIRWLADDHDCGDLNFRDDKITAFAMFDDKNLACKSTVFLALTDPEDPEPAKEEPADPPAIAADSAQAAKPAAKKKPAK